MGLLGFGEAAHHYEVALATVDALPGDHLEDRCRLLLRLGAAQRALGLTGSTRGSFHEAAQLALALDSPLYLAEAAWGLVRMTEYSTQYPENITLLRLALDRIDAVDSPLRAKLTAGLARALPAWQPEARQLAEAAVEMATRLDDSETIVVARIAVSFTTWAPGNLEQRLAAHSDIIERADTLGWIDVSAEARMWRSACAEELGDPSTADADLAVLAHYARTSRRPVFAALRDLRGAGRALLAGRYEEAEELAHATLAAVEAGPYFISGFGVQLFALRRDQGRLSELESLIIEAVATSPDVVAWRVALALVHAELGRRDAAADILDGLAGDGFAGPPRGWLWLAAMTYVADLCALLERPDLAVPAYDLLVPFENRNVVLAHGVLLLGSGARALGDLAAVLGRWEDAERHFGHALDVNARLGATPYVARTLAGRAAMGAARGRSDDRVRAEKDRAEADRLAASIGMGGLRTTLERAQIA
jgi:tetratricopeptide (TPR) repeat protein